jgi:hypothetical protein
MMLNIPKPEDLSIFEWAIHPANPNRISPTGEDLIHQLYGLSQKKGYAWARLDITKFL